MINSNPRNLSREGSLHHFFVICQSLCQSLYLIGSFRTSLSNGVPCVPSQAVHVLPYRARPSRIPPEFLHTICTAGSMDCSSYRIQWAGYRYCSSALQMMQFSNACLYYKYGKLCNHILCYNNRKGVAQQLVQLPQRFVRLGQSHYTTFSAMKGQTLLITYVYRCQPLTRRRRVEYMITKNTNHCNAVTLKFIIAVK